MDLRKIWKALKSCLRRRFFSFFRNGGTEQRAGKAPGVRQLADASGDLAVKICERLEYLRRKRIFSVRKKSGGLEWLVRPADFTDAYLFLLGISGMDSSRLQRRMVAGNVNFKLVLPGKCMLELTDNTRSGTVQALLRLTEGGQCALKIYFINS